MEDNSCRLAVTFMFEFDEIVGKVFNERGIENLCLIFREMIEDITCQSEHVYDCEVDKEKVDEAIDAGKLTLYNDGDRIVIARGVTSLVTVTETETEDLKKIKILAIQDLIETDIYSTINKSYVGNYSNSYDNKQLLVTAIRAYLSKLSTDEGGKGYINSNYTMEISVAKQKMYLEAHGIDTSEMDEQAIKEANTGSYVGLDGRVG